jgi:hypothetical protein
MNSSQKRLQPSARSTTLCLLTCCSAVLLMGAQPSPSWAADPFNAVVVSDKPAKGPKNKTPKKPPPTGSAETPKERDHRLWRECRGKPNAGACEGFAS